MRRIFGMALVLACGGCGTSRTPMDARQGGELGRFVFNQSLPAAKACLIPGFDQIKPFNFPPQDTRPVMVRDLPNKSEIYAQDEMITLYVVDLAASGPARAIATVYVGPERITSQLVEVVQRCGGVAGT